MDTKPDTITASHCNSCLRTTNHHILREFKHESEEWIENNNESRFPVIDSDNFEILQCCGCSSMIIRHTKWFDRIRDGDGNPVTDVYYYPPAKSRNLPDWLNGVDWVLEDLYGHFIPRLLKQVYAALFNNCQGLAAMGIRAILEQMMIDKVGDSNSFGANLKKFQQEGYASNIQVDQLSEILELGHAAIHRNFNPDVQQIITALNITESILATCYQHPKDIEGMIDRIPKKKSK